MNKDYNSESENHRVVEKHLRDSPKVKMQCALSLENVIGQSSFLY